MPNQPTPATARKAAAKKAAPKKAAASEPTSSPDISDKALAAGAVRPSRKGGRPKKALPPAHPDFPEGATPKRLGEVNPDAAKAKSDDPERFTPKISLVDGKTPKVGMPVMARDGRRGEIVVTFQAWSRVKFDKGGRATLPNVHLVSTGPAPRNAQTPAKA